MTDTNDRPDNEAWLFETLVELEDKELLADFCRHIDLLMPISATVIAEGIWPLIKEKYILKDGKFDAARASRDFLAFRPLQHQMARHLKNDGK